MPCPGCGAPGAGRAACQALFDDLSARAWSDPQMAALHNLVVDAYCLQHPQEYCESAKSYAAHLAGLCWAMEHGGDATVYWAIPRWLNGGSDLRRPEFPERRGSRTIADVHAAAGTSTYSAAATGWAADVWAAYAPQHELARGWMQAVIACHRQRR